MYATSGHRCELPDFQSGRAIFFFEHPMDMDTGEEIRSDRVVSYSPSGVSDVSPEWNAFESDILKLLLEEKPSPTGNRHTHQLIKQAHHNLLYCVYRYSWEENSNKKWGK